MHHGAREPRQDAAASCLLPHAYGRSTQQSCLVLIRLPQEFCSFSVKREQIKHAVIWYLAGQHVAMAAESAYLLALQLGTLGPTPTALRAYEDSRVGRLQDVADIEWASLLPNKPLP